MGGCRFIHLTVSFQGLNLAPAVPYKSMDADAKGSIAAGSASPGYSTWDGIRVMVVLSEWALNQVT